MLQHNNAAEVGCPASHFNIPAFFIDQKMSDSAEPFNHLGYGKLTRESRIRRGSPPTNHFQPTAVPCLSRTIGPLLVLSCLAAMEGCHRTAETPIFPAEITADKDHLLGDEGTVFSYADVSIIRRLNLRPRSREIAESEAAANELLSELRKAKARIVTDESGEIVEIQCSELDTRALSDGAIRDLRKQFSLRCLSIRAPQLIRQLLPEINALPMLEELGLCAERLSTDAIQSLNRAPALSRLSLEETRMDKKSAEAIANLPHLNSLHLDSCRYPAGIDATFVAMPGLKSLWISGGVNDGPHPLRALESFPGLQCLWIDSIWCNRDAMQQIGRLTQLEELSLQYVGLDDEMLQELRPLTKMRRAILGNTTDFTGDGLRHVASWQNLENLSVFSTSFEDDAAKQLSQFPALKAFVAHDTFLTDASIDSLVKLANLKVAWVSKTKISSAGMERLKKQLPACRVR